jgi:hypothetical protein
MDPSGTDHIPGPLLRDIEAERAHQERLGVPGKIELSIDVNRHGRICAYDFGGRRRRQLERDRAPHEEENP